MISSSALGRLLACWLLLEFDDAQGVVACTLRYLNSGYTLLVETRQVP